MADQGAQERARAELVERIGHVVRDPRVLQAMRDVPRHRFVPSEVRRYAYEDTALAVGAGQTISQPTVVATMTQAAALTGSEHLLEIGTGSGYQAAVLARLAADVVSVEVVDVLRERAAALLAELGIENVRVLPAGDELGASEYAPYDAILITAAAPRVPSVLVEQLRMGGRVVAPVGSIHSQELLVGTRVPSGLETRSLGACRFVPLVGPEGFVSRE